ncbi:peptidylprolyl isomerase [Devosia sp. 1635]|uniref:peptidylprolyl isomerase n=1 Tax=Devosia sp. 1635 TaxID=2726066 RepID=UPI0015643D9B|nr:peptidylprolyl isomerase [Devosia sp. 1635]
MLDSLRLFAKSWMGKILGAFLLVGLAGFGINNVITDLGGSTVARVGDEEVSSRDFLRAYRGQLNQIAQQIGSMPTLEQAESFGVPSLVLQSLAQEAALDGLAHRMGLGVSEQKLSEFLREDPNFSGTLGTFDPAVFQQVLQQNGMSESEYFEDQADSARRQQLALSLFGDTSLPPTAAQMLNRYIADQRTVDFFVISDTNVPMPPVPTEEELAAYLAEHQAEYRTVETRQVQLLALSPASLAATKTISDEAVAAEYERTKDSLTTIERRNIQQAVLASPEQAALFEAGAASGRPFADVVAEAGLTVTDLGTRGQAEITDATLAEAAFSLPAGGYRVISGVAGPRVVHVQTIEAGGQTSLEEAREQIRENLALAEARKEIAEVLDQVEELRAAFRPLSEIAERFGLELYEVGVTQSGAELAVIASLPESERPRVVQSIFAAQEGNLTPAISLGANNNIWFDLEAIEPARDQTLDEVRDAVVAAITAERINAAIATEAQAAVDRLKAGEPLADVAASLSVFPQLSPPFNRGGAEGTSVDGLVAAAAFDGGPDHHGMAINQAGETVVFQVVEAVPAEGPLNPQTSASLENEVRVGLFGDFVSAVRDEAGLRVNEQALQQALTLSTAQ